MNLCRVELLQKIEAMIRGEIVIFTNVDQLCLTVAFHNFHREFSMNNDVEPQNNPVFRNEFPSSYRQSLQRNRSPLSVA